MEDSIKTIFPTFSNELIQEIENNAIYQSYKAGDVIMRTGQYINNTVLVTKGQIKIYREGENGGEFFMYYLQPGQACAISMICATKSQTSQITAKAVDDVELIMVPLALMEKWMMHYHSWYEFVIFTYRTRFEEVLEVIDSIAFRAMPNIAADIQESVTCVCSQHANLDQIQLVSELFDGIGFTIPIDESLMEAATVLGACGIAYVLRFMRAMIQGGIQIGFDSVTASKIVNQTVKGAAELMIQKNMHPEAAIDKVTTPKGCTIVGLNEMEHQGFSSAMVRGVIASYEKIAK